MTASETLVQDSCLKRPQLIGWITVPSSPGTSWLKDRYRHPPKPRSRIRSAHLFPYAWPIHPMSWGLFRVLAAVRSAVQAPTAFLVPGIGWTSGGSSCRSLGWGSPQDLSCLGSGTAGSQAATAKAWPSIDAPANLRCRDARGSQSAGGVSLVSTVTVAKEIPGAGDKVYGSRQSVRRECACVIRCKSRPHGLLSKLLIWGRRCL